jgi:streptogramin lyase
MANKSILMKIFKPIFFSLLVAVLFPLYAQSQIAIGEWRDHLPYLRTIAVVDAGDRVYCATDYSLFYYDKTDYTITRLTKVNGLSDIGISSMSYNETYKTLLIAYSNANIDLIKDNEVINISDIKRKPILGNKTINNILFVDKLAYLACGFGIVVLDVDKEEFPEPIYYIGENGSQINVLDVTFGADSLFAATEKGIFKASINSPNLADFASWSVDQHLYPNRYYSLIEYYSGKLIVNNLNEGYHADTAFIYDFGTSTWSKFSGLNNYRKHSFKTQNDKLVLVSEGTVDIYNNMMQPLVGIYQINGVFLNSRDAAIDKDDVKWIADYSIGLIKTSNGETGEFISPNGPYSASVFDMSLAGKDLWVASGGHASNWGKIYNSDGVYSFVDETWESYNRFNGDTVFNTISDMVCVAVDPNNTARAYVGTWQSGVMEFLDGQVANIYDHSNSSLQKWPAGNYVAISGLAFDNNNNLWVANSGAPSMISVKETNGTWTAFSLGSGASGTDIGNMIVDNYNQKWVLMRADNSLLCFSERATISDPTDDKVKILSNAAGNGSLPGSKILSIAQDLDGELWLGSNEGIGVIYSPENVFETGASYDAQRILVEVGGYTQYLLESESVTAIAIDGANRKWIGTERAGVFLLSPDGTEEILHFTSENSPLYSDFIIDIEINGETGEVFFGTQAGIISYKSTATDPNPTNTDVVAYPNPVREGYSGTIAIKGLVANADIKITDISGTLIYSTRAEGGQAVWDGRNFDGRKAQTGVYLIFSGDDEGKENLVTKILFIN